MKTNRATWYDLIESHKYSEINQILKICTVSFQLYKISNWTKL